MENNKKQWAIIALMSIVWGIVLVVFYPLLPQIIAIQVNLAGEVSRSASKLSVYGVLIVLMVSYVLFTMIQFRRQNIPNKHLMIGVLLLFVSVFTLVFGWIMS